MDCHQFEEIAGAYALRALSDEERRIADAHLATCASCRHMVQELQEITDLLPLTVPAVAPSPRLQKRVMASIKADAQQHAATRRARQPSRQVPWWHYWQTRAALAFALLLLILSTALAGWNLSLQQQLTSANNQAITYTIQGSDQTAGASGEAIYLPRLQMTILTINGLPAPKRTEVYQGWLITNNRPISIGLLNIHNNTASLNFPGDIRGYDTMAISLEPGPQASPDAPKGPIVAAGSLKADKSR